MDLFDAISAGDAEAVMAALDRGGDVGTRDGIPPALWALYGGRRDLATLIAHHRDLTDAEAAALDRLRPPVTAGQAAAQTADGYTLLHLAAFFGAPTAASLLLTAGADPDRVAAHPSRVTALHSAVAGRHRAIVELLVAAGADPHARQQGGWTPLHAAAQHGDRPIVAALLAAGADRGAVNDDGLTPADLALAAGHPALADDLVP